MFITLHVYFFKYITYYFYISYFINGLISVNKKEDFMQHILKHLFICFSFKRKWIERYKNVQFLHERIISENQLLIDWTLISDFVWRNLYFCNINQMQFRLYRVTYKNDSSGLASTDNVDFVNMVEEDISVCVARVKIRRAILASYCHLFCYHIALISCYLPPFLSVMASCG